MEFGTLIIWAVQIGLIVHVLKTGRSRWWILFLVFMPLIGGLAYVIVELLPEYTNSMSGQRTLRQVKKTLDPGGDVRHHQAAWEQSPNTDNARRYAEALLEVGEEAEAEKVVNDALTGMFEFEPTLLLVRARIEYSQGRFSEALASLEALQEHNPEFRSADGHLLYARALESCGKTDQALEEYDAIAGYFPGVEARYRKGLALKAAGRKQEATAEWKSIIIDAGHAPDHFRKAQKPWIDATRKALASD